ncbi:TetR family transcriptional regulator [Marinobacterium iners]|uniref:Transcriptional regulator, TetR family n=1 Tax=Marinobacterium iners DSM 11526 TaxID=1122198 RepID=A0A1H4DLM5_9GAMM|nr:TetR family transcriptional regulator [Marinobacterium iners]SEA73112.1 transcriptional regulator, TetR family [Marinobacterium iners DSM 11526]
MARRTPEEAEQTRQQLLATGLKLFSEQGVEATTLKQIAQVAGVTHGALYWHFRNRADLLQQIHHAWMLPFEPVWLEQCQALQQDALAALKLYLLGVLDGFEQDAEACALYRVFYQPVVLCNDLKPLFDSLEQNRELWLDQLRRFLKQARKQKQLRKKPDPVELAFTLQQAMNGLLHEWLRTGRSFGLKARGEQLVELLFAGLPYK